MKVAILSKVYGMSLVRDKAVSKIASLSDKIEEHLLKCLVYKNSTDDYRHWIDDELATWISLVNDITIKPKDKKLKVKDYQSNLFGGLGDTYADANFALHLFRSNYTDSRKCKEPYPYFDITTELISTTLDAFTDIQSTLCEVLAKKNGLDKANIAKLLHTILDKYCI